MPRKLLPSRIKSVLLLFQKNAGKEFYFRRLSARVAHAPRAPGQSSFFKKSWITDSMAVASLEISFFAPAPAPVHREPGKSVEISPNGCSHAPFFPVFPKEKGQEAQAARPVLDSFRDFSGMRDFPGRASRPCLSRRLVVSCP